MEVRNRKNQRAAYVLAECMVLNLIPVGLTAAGLPGYIMSGDASPMLMSLATTAGVNYFYDRSPIGDGGNSPFRLILRTLLD